MSHVETIPDWTTVYAATQILPWDSLHTTNGSKVSKEGTGSVGYIPFYRTREEVIKLFGDVKILEFKRVEEETSREEEDGPQGLGKREAVPQKRKGCCGGKACKATRPATEGDGGCH